METKSWKEIKDNVYGEKGTERRDELEREIQGFKIGLLLKKAREEKHLTQSELGDLVDKKREYISRIENNKIQKKTLLLYREKFREYKPVGEILGQRIFSFNVSSYFYFINIY